jgi:hypothetical protein
LCGGGGGEGGPVVATTEASSSPSTDESSESRGPVAGAESDEGDEVVVLPAELAIDEGESHRDDNDMLSDVASERIEEHFDRHDDVEGGGSPNVTLLDDPIGSIAEISFDASCASVEASDEKEALEGPLSFDFDEGAPGGRRTGDLGSV